MGLISLLGHLWALQYPASAFVVCLTVIYVYRRNPSGIGYHSFLAYGATVALWQVLAYLHRIVPDSETSAILFRMAMPVYSFVMPILLFCLLSIWNDRPVNWLSFGPSLVNFATYAFFFRPAIVPTVYGWSFLFVFESQYAFFVAGISHFFYIFMTTMILMYLMTQHRIYPVFRRKYVLILSAFFLFQAVGLTVSNVLLQSYPELPPIGGFLYIGSFVSLGYALLLIQSSVKLSSAVGKLEEIGSAYTYFLGQYYTTLPGSEFGQADPLFRDFVSAARLEGFVRVSNEGFVVDPNLLSKMDAVAVSQGVISALEKIKEGSSAAAEYFAYPLSVTCLKAERGDFEERIVNPNLDFLVRSDLLHNLSYGGFLEGIEQDSSLDGMTDWHASMRLYKRFLAAMLVPTTYHEIEKDLARQKQLYRLAKYAEFSPLGNPIFSHLEVQLIRMPEDERMRSLMQNMNSLIIWLIERIYAQSEQDGNQTLRSIREVVRMNRYLAVRLKIYPMLVSTLSTRISRTRLLNLFSIGEQTPFEMDVFSRMLGKVHEEMAGLVVLLEFDPHFPFGKTIQTLVSEARANEEDIAVFTRPNSEIDSSIDSSIAGKYFLTLSSSLPEARGRIIPLRDTVALLGVATTLARTGRTLCIVFDNLTDLALNLGAQNAYTTMRHLADTLAEVMGPLVFLVNARAHTPDVLSTFEMTANVIIMQEEENVRIIKK